MRLLFAGTPEIALPTLRFVAERHEVVAVLTAPDRPVGRGRHVEARVVKQAAEQLGVPVLQPERLNGLVRDTIAELQPELLVCVAFVKIFGPKFLALFPRGGINLHPSLLPKYRGPSPIPAAILAGDAETGVTIQYLAPEMDAGDILAQETLTVSCDDTTQTLTERAAALGARLALQVVDEIAAGVERPRRQIDTDATYTHIIEKEEGRIDWGRPASFIARMVRAFNPWPGAFTTFEGRTLNNLEARP